MNRAGSAATTGAVSLATRLAVCVWLAAPGAGLADPAPPGGAVVPSTRADRAESAERIRELASFQKLLEDERSRPSRSRLRDPVDREGHHLLVFAETPEGTMRRVDTFEHALFVRTTFVLLLDPHRRLRFLVIEPEEGGHHQAFEIDAYLFDAEGRTVARDHTYGTSLDCADGRLHERRTVTAFRPGLRVISRAIEYANDFGPSPRAQGCALREPGAPLPDAPALVRAYRLEQAARAAGVRLPPAGEVRRD